LPGQRRPGQVPRSALGLARLGTGWGGVDPRFADLGEAWGFQKDILGKTDLAGNVDVEWCRFTSKLSFSFFYSWDIWNTKWYCMVGGSYIVYLYSVCDVLYIIMQKKHMGFWSSLRCMDVWYIYIYMFDDVCVKVRTDPKEPTYINSSPLL
jgi:hypothetical protein